MSVANAKGHGLDTRTDFATTAADPQLSWRGLRVQATAYRSDAPPGARQSHPRGARPGLAADVPPPIRPEALPSKVTGSPESSRVRTRVPVNVQPRRVGFVAWKGVTLMGPSRSRRSSAR